MDFSDAVLSHVMLTIAICTYITIFLSLLKLAWMMCDSPVLWKWNISKVIHCLIPCAMIVKGIDVTFIYQKVGGPREFLLDAWERQTPLQMYLSALPGYLSVSTFILLALFWFSLYTKAHDEITHIQRNIRALYLGINGFLYTCWGIILILMFTTTGDLQVTVHRVEGMFTTIVSGLMALLYVIVGVKLYIKLKRQSVVSYERLLISRKVALLTLCFTTVFILRAPFIFTGFYLRPPDIITFINRILSSFFVDFFPVYVTLIVLRKKRQIRDRIVNRLENQKLNGYGSAKLLPKD